MRLGGTKTKIALVVLLLAGGFAAYWAGYHLWGRHHYQAAQESLKRREFRQAGIHLRTCLDAWPRDPSIRLLAAQAARRGGALDEAKRHLEIHATQKAQTDERGREYQLLYIQEGDLRGADRLLDRALADPTASEEYLVLETIIDAKVKLLTSAHDSGMTLVEGPAGEERDRTDRAIEVWREVRPEKADQVQGLVWRGRIHLLLNLQEAAADFRKALELDPNHFDARLLLAIALAESSPREAAGHLEILRGREPQNIRVSIYLASTLRGLGQLAEAQRILDDVLTANVDHSQALLERGKTALDAAHPDEAEPFLRRALARTPGEPFVHLALSRCLHLQGKAEEARYHQQKHSEIESERTRIRQLHDEEARIAWRKRVEQGKDR
ncbi:MAG: tetratricopeptide repeat protein [Gemmataceae bacterium]|nr:tetratricopeptide repeat protein [Gemmataceae bacterium]